MSDINFLPQSYRNRLSRRVRHVREGFVVLATVITLCVWWAYDANELLELREASRFAEDRLTSALSTEQIVKELEARRTKLVDQRRLQREISVPIRHHQVVRVLGGLLPTSVTLTRLSLENDRPEPKAYVPPSTKQAQEAQPSFGSQAATTHAAAVRDRVLIEMEGLAPDDIAVAEVIAELSGHPLFEKVQLHTSKYLETRGVAARSFRITGQIDLTRDIAWIPAVEFDSSADELAEVATQDSP